MYKLVQKRRWYFLFSGIVILLGLVAMGISLSSDGSVVLLSVDFTGGSLFELKFLPTPQDHLEAIAAPYTGDVAPEVTDLGDGKWQVTVGPDTSSDQLADLSTDLKALDPEVDQEDRQFTLTIDPATTYNESSETAIYDVFTAYDLDDPRIQQLGEVEEHRWSIRTSFVEEETQAKIIADLEAQIAPLDQGALRIERVTATVGNEVTKASLFAVMAVAVLILGFIVWAFRKVPNAFRYGACAIVTMFHDVLITLGAMSILGLLFGWEADALFLTAVLTVVGYSVQDTIVIFDRIRENLPRRRGEPFETIVNRSLLETIHRSLATQINAIFVMVAILLFGGETIKQFIAILLVGLATGTYSSIFIAAPLLVAWEKGEIPILNRLQR